MISSLFSCSTPVEQKNETPKEAIKTGEINSTEFIKGKKIYDALCANCHAPKGQGIGKLYPPLAQSDYLAANTRSIACLIKRGSQEPMTVNGVTYKMPMPAQNGLNEVEISDLLNYIFNAWGNKLGPVTQEQVLEDWEECK
ncbi:MAG: cytochrome c [Cyclobacteriaceae bacterium]